MANEADKSSDHSPSIENPTKTTDTLPPLLGLKPDVTGKDLDDVSKPALADSSAATAPPVSDIEKKIRRAERFGISVQLSEVEKRNSRAERFGTVTGSASPTPPAAGAEVSKRSEELKRKARAERFDMPSLTVTSDEEGKKKVTSDEEGKKKVTSDEEGKKKVTSDEEAKKKARLARFAPASKTDPIEDDKRKARALRFSSTPSNSVPQVDGKSNIEQNAAIADEAGGI